MQSNIHRVKSIEIQEVQKYDTFCTRNINVVNDEGLSFTLELFADKKENLDIDILQHKKL